MDFKPLYLIYPKGFTFLNMVIFKHQEPGRCQRRVPEVDQSVKIQLPFVEDGEGFLQNICFKNVSVVEQFQIFMVVYNSLYLYL